MSERLVAVERPNLTLARIVREAMGELSWNKARDLCRTGRVWIGDDRARDPELLVAVGERVRIDPNAPRERLRGLSPDAIVYADADVVVVNKPAGLLSVPYAEGDRDTLVDQLRALLRRRPGGRFSCDLGIVHRIDIDTTGLLVFARNLAAKRHLSQQFRVHSVHRRYWALAHGSVAERSFDTLLMTNRGDGLRGSWGAFRRPKGKPPRDLRRAVSHVRVLRELRGATLVEVALETGRQHQIRIHLSEAGHPLLGERVYIRDYRQELLKAPRPMLHARELGFEHPRKGNLLQFVQAPPEDFVQVLARLQAD